jgi:hypothetical protein
MMEWWGMASTVQDCKTAADSGSEILLRAERYLQSTNTPDSSEII